MFWIVSARIIFGMQEVEDRWQERRAENSIPNRRVPQSHMDVSVFKQKEAYMDKYEEYTWFPVDAYIQKAAGSDTLQSLGTLKRKLDFITNQLGQQVVYDNGEAGVTVKAHADGRKKICLGSRTGMTKRQDLSEASGVGQVEEVFTGWQNESQAQFSGVRSLTDVQMQLENASTEDIMAKSLRYYRFFPKNICKGFVCLVWDLFSWLINLH